MNLYHPLICVEHLKRNSRIWTACISGPPSAPKQDFDVGMAWIIGKAYVMAQTTKKISMLIWLQHVWASKTGKEKSLRTTQLKGNINHQEKKILIKKSIKYSTRK